MDTFLHGNVRLPQRLPMPAECVHHVSEHPFTISPVHTEGEGGVGGEVSRGASGYRGRRASISSQQRSK
jgi:hypothetical protein